MPIVYCATNVMNGKHYIGASKNPLKTRMAQHINNAKNASSSGRFYAAIRKYGADCFLWETLASVDTAHEAFMREQRLVAAMHPEYNIKEGGECGGGQLAWNRKKVICLEDGKIFDSITEAASFYRLDLSTLSKVIRGIGSSLSEKHFIRYTGPLTEEERISRVKNIDLKAAFKRRRGGKVPVPVKNGKDLLGRSAAGPLKNAKPVLCNSDGLFFPSSSAAAAYYGLSVTALSGLLNKRQYRKTVGGLKFSHFRAE